MQSHASHATPAMTPDPRAVREAACALRALQATCTQPQRLPGLAVQRRLALGLRLDLPDVVASGDATRVVELGLLRDHAAMLFRSFAAADVDRLRAATRCLAQGLQPARLRAALDAWDAEAADRLRRDPYGALFDLKGTLDEAKACAAHMTDDQHVVHRARWFLKLACRDGHTMAPYRQVLARLGDDDATRRALDDAVRDGSLLTRVGADHLADPDACVVEQAIARDVARRCDAAVLDAADLRFDGLTDEQDGALRTVLARGIGVLTGGPGTGKSHVVRALVDALGEDACMLTAPTGRAARRVGGATVHSASGGRLLRRRPLQETTAADVAPSVRVLVVDEASMLSTELMTGVLNLAPRDCVVLLVGDADQLPPVAAGNVLIDLIDCGLVPVGRLTYNHRSVTNVQRIALEVLHGRVPAEPLDWERDGVAGVVRAAAGRAGTTECAVLTPYNAGRHLLNRVLQSSVRDVPVTTRDARQALLRTDVVTGQSSLVGSSVPVALGATKPVHPMLPGDAVMVTRNQNKKRPRPGEVSACNGDVGRLVRLAPKPLVRFEDGDAEFAAVDPWLTLGYATTVHKAQGSEADHVVLPLYAPEQWDAQMLYTAITRARQRVTFVGSRADLETAVARRRPRRRSLLASMLADAASL